MQFIDTKSQDNLCSSRRHFVRGKSLDKRLSHCEVKDYQVYKNVLY
jgi:hypothetical protein